MSTKVRIILNQPTSDQINKEKPYITLVNDKTNQVLCTFSVEKTDLSKKPFKLDITYIITDEIKVEK
ncbi:MAG: hypothetical protein WCO35_01795 [Candidatus Nomurabacteria bacterium]